MSGVGHSHWLNFCRGCSVYFSRFLSGIIFIANFLFLKNQVNFILVHLNRLGKEKQLLIFRAHIRLSLRISGSWLFSP
jgi:hypothetical protein